MECTVLTNYHVIVFIFGSSVAHEGSFVALVGSFVALWALFGFRHQCSGFWWLHKALQFGYIRFIYIRLLSSSFFFLSIFAPQVIQVVFPCPCPPLSVFPIPSIISALSLVI